MASDHDRYDERSDERRDRDEDRYGDLAGVDDNVARSTAYGDDERVYAEGTAEEDEGGWLTKGVATMLIVTGAILFLFPEPVTSTVGIVLLIAGVVAWAAAALR